MANTLFPVFLKFDHLELLIVGGGYVGWEKIGAVLRNSPDVSVTLVADFIREEILELAKKYPNVKLVHRKFEYSDLDGKDVVILATNDKELHKEIKVETRKRHLLTNVADTPDLCDFYLSSVVQKGDLKVAISTNGKSPTLAKRMREYLEEAIPDNIQEVLDNLKVYRDKLKGDFEYKVKKLNEVTSEFSKKK